MNRSLRRMSLLLAASVLAACASDPDPYAMYEPFMPGADVAMATPARAATADVSPAPVATPARPRVTTLAETLMLAEENVVPGTPVSGSLVVPIAEEGLFRARDFVELEVQTGGRSYVETAADVGTCWRNNERVTPVMDVAAGSVVEMANAWTDLEGVKMCLATMGYEGGLRTSTPHPLAGDFTRSASNDPMPARQTTPAQPVAMQVEAVAGPSPATVGEPITPMTPSVPVASSPVPASPETAPRVIRRTNMPGWATSTSVAAPASTSPIVLRGANRPVQAPAPQPAPAPVAPSVATPAPEPATVPAAPTGDRNDFFRAVAPSARAATPPSTTGVVQTTRPLPPAPSERVMQSPARAATAAPQVQEVAPLPEPQPAPASPRPSPNDNLPTLDELLSGKVD